MGRGRIEDGIDSFAELYEALDTLEGLEELGNLCQSSPQVITIQKSEVLWMRLKDTGHGVLAEDIYCETPFTWYDFSYGAAYGYLADTVKRLAVQKERFEIFRSGIFYILLCTVLFTAWMMGLQAGVLQGIFHIRTMETPGRFALVAGTILVSALVSAVLSKTAIPSFTREPAERRMRLGSTIACFVAGIVFIAGSGYLLLAIWLFFETETPFYVYLSLTACFGMIFSIGIAVILVTAKHRKQ